MQDLDQAKRQIEDLKKESEEKIADLTSQLE
jgi:hypothetical protein